jgi:hypothetical protein
MKKKGKAPPSHRRDVEIMVAARLARAIDVLHQAQLTVRDHGLGERLELQMIRALDELAEGEALNDWSLARNPTLAVPGRIYVGSSEILAN